MSRSLMRRLAVGPLAVFALVAMATACTSENEGTVTPTADSGISGPDTTAVQSNVRLAEMWGHLETSAASLANGNSEDAILHSAHPIAEYWTLVSGSLEEVGQDEAVRAAIDAYQAALESGDGVEAAAENVRGALLATMAALSDDQIDEPQFRAAVISDLVESIEHEFEESVEDGSLTNLPEYQDAWGFLQVAKRLYEPIKSEAEGTDAEAAHEIEEELEALDAIFATLRPSSPPSTVEDVEEAVGEIRAELAKIFELGAAAAATPAEIVAQVKEMLEHAIAEYNEGEIDEAYELAANAYLEGFEHVEGAIIQVGRRELVEELELKLKDFRDGIRDEGPVETLEQLRIDIETRLDEALEALG